MNQENKGNKGNKLLKIIQWFFEEEKDSEQANSDEDAINLGPIQIVLILIMTGILVAWIFFEPLKVFFNRPVPKPRDYIEAHIEKNYFAHGHGLKNKDFSKGIQHWATSDGGTLFPDSKSIASIENKDFHSAPSCLKIECIVPASRYHYSKKINSGVINNVYSYKEPLSWMGILPGMQVKASLWYKGDIIRFAINYLKNNGEWSNLSSVSGPASSQWNQLEINEKAPLNARAIMLEITLNQSQGMPLPAVFIDDVNIDIDNPGLTK